MTAEPVPERGVDLSPEEIERALQENRPLVERLAAGDAHALASIFEALGARVASVKRLG